MSIHNIKSLEQLQREADDALAALAEGKRQKIENDKKAFQERLKSAETVFSALDKESQAAVLASPEMRLLFAAFDMPKKKRKVSKGSKFDETALLDFLGADEKDQTDIATHFGVSRQSVGTWKKKLGEKVKIVKRGTSNFWRKI